MMDAAGKLGPAAFFYCKKDLTIVLTFAYLLSKSRVTHTFKGINKMGSMTKKLKRANEKLARMRERYPWRKFMDRFRQINKRLRCPGMIAKGLQNVQM